MRAIELNTAFRSTFVGGAVEITPAFEALPPDDKRDLLAKVRQDEGDRHGQVELNGHTAVWRIDTLDRECEHESPDPADPTVTTRILVIGLLH